MHVPFPERYQNPALEPGLGKGSEGECLVVPLPMGTGQSNGRLLSRK